MVGVEEVWKSEHKNGFRNIRSSKHQVEMIKFKLKLYFLKNLFLKKLYLL